VPQCLSGAGSAAAQRIVPPFRHPSKTITNFLFPPAHARKPRDVCSRKSRLRRRSRMEQGWPRPVFVILGAWAPRDLAPTGHAATEMLRMLES
jgi:hypothetical protein